MKFFKPFEMPVPPAFPDKVFDIRDFGAVSDDGKHPENANETSSWQAIKTAIKECSQSGGGKVVVPEGVWHTGPIHLADNVNLCFEKGSYVHFSENFYDYLPTVFGILGGNRCYSPSHFIYAYKCKNIAVTGSGTLDGHGKAWWYMKNHQPGMEDLTVKGRLLRPFSERVYDKPEDGVRPRMLQFVECENVLIEGITMKNSPSWTVHPAWCRNIIVRGLTIRNPHDAPNTDGVNFDSCKRGLIEHCNVKTGDDMVCLKAGKDQDAWAVGVPCEDIVVRYCSSEGGHGGLTIGSETSACVKNAYIHDCSFGRLYSAVRIKTMKGRGGYVENIDFENFTIEYAERQAISLTMRYDGEPLDDQSKPLENMPEIRNISVTNLRCGNSVKGIEILGTAGYEIKNIHLGSIDIVSEKPIVAENVMGLNLENVNLKFGAEQK